MSAAQIITWIVLPVALTALVLSFTFLILNSAEKEKLLIKSGIRDEAIIKNHDKAQQKKGKAGRIITLVVEAVLLVIFLFAIFIGIYSAAFKNDFPLFGVELKVVASDSMASVHKNNEYYILPGQLDNRFRTDDLLVINTLPAEEDIKVFDIVTYKNTSGQIIIHRIISIQDTAEGKTYILRGDASPTSDNPIKYSDMRGIYNGNKLSGVGVFIRFIQSPFGIIAIFVCLYICILEEIVTSKLQKIEKARAVELTGDKPD